MRGIGGSEDAVQIGHALLLVPLEFGNDPGPAPLALVVGFDVVFFVGAVEGIVLAGKADKQRLNFQHILEGGDDGDRAAIGLQHRRPAPFVLQARGSRAQPMGSIPAR